MPFTKSGMRIWKSGKSMRDMNRAERGAASEETDLSEIHI